MINSINISCYDVKSINFISLLLKPDLKIISKYFRYNLVIFKNLL